MAPWTTCIANPDRLQLCLSSSSTSAAILIGLMRSPWTSGNGSGIPRIYTSTTVLGKCCSVALFNLKAASDSFDSPGDPFYKAVGAVYANASLTLLNQGPEKAGTMYFNL